MIRVLIADDHPVVRSGLEMILSKDPNIAVIGAVENGHQRRIDPVRPGEQTHRIAS